MSYIAFDLDALNVVPDVASACGLPPGDVAHGLLKLWAWCFREKTDMVSTTHLSGFFGGKAAGGALEAFHFLEAEGTNWRVRGASRYLRIAAGRSKGGKAASANLKRGQKKAPKRAIQPEGGAGGSAGAIAGDQPETSREQAGADPRLASGLSPTTDDRTPKQPTDARLKPLTERLVATFAEVRGSKYLHAGVEDATGLKRLLAVATDDEVDRRWRLALKAAGWPGTSSLAQLAGSKRWNDLAAAKPVQISIEHQPSRIY